MNSITIRTVTAADAPVLRALAKGCTPLDVHTPYTYWVVCNYHQNCTFLMECDGKPTGYIMAIHTPRCVFIWQIGLTPPFRGKQLSSRLIEKVVSYARSQKMNIQLSIASGNAASNAAFRSYCDAHTLQMQPIGHVALHDLIDPDFMENEELYQITL